MVPVQPRPCHGRLDPGPSSSETVIVNHRQHAVHQTLSEVSELGQDMNIVLQLRSYRTEVPCPAHASQTLDVIAVAKAREDLAAVIEAMYRASGRQ